MRAKLAGRATALGGTELRHLIEHLDATGIEAWNAVRTVFGATPEVPHIDPAAVLRGAVRAAACVRDVAATHGRIAFATATPASLLGVHATLARLARERGGDVVDGEDSGPMRIDGRAPRWIRWLDGIAVVTDGTALLGAVGPDGPKEWLFLIGRPRLAVADGPYAEAAHAAGIDVVAIVGLDRPALALPAARGAGCTVVPVPTARPARAYAPLVRALEMAFRGSSAPASP
ncbi:MAG: phosphatase [Actinomycetota bacterium]